MMNMIFTFRRAGKSQSGETVLQDNYINPFQVISAFWEEREGGKKVLMVFSLTYTFVLPESTGKNFLNHWETALRLITNPTQGAGVVAEQPRSERRPRQVMDATVVDDTDLTAVEWSDK